MKHKIILAIALLSGGLAYADQPPGPPPHHGPEGFIIGVCVGQTLAGEGITLPVPKAGQPPQLDSATESALHAAVESCRTQVGAPDKQTDKQDQ